MNRKSIQIISALIISFFLWGSISLSSYYFTSVKVPVRLTNLPAGYAMAPTGGKLVSISLKGEGWRLLVLSMNKTDEYFVSANYDSGYKHLNLNQSLSDNNWLSNGLQVMDISPDTMTFRIEEIARKMVRIKPVLNLSFKPHFGIVSAIRIIPDSVMISGPKSLLRRIPYISTVPEQISDLEGRTTETLKLEDIDNLNYSSRECKVILNVQKIVDKVFSGIEVKVLNSPSHGEITLFPNRMDFVLRGGIDILGRLKSEDFHPYIDYQQMLSDTLGSIDPVLKVPDYTTVIKKDPERIKYIIKKF